MSNDEKAASVMSQLGRMPAAIQLKVLAHLNPEVYIDNDDAPTEPVQAIPFSWPVVFSELSARGVAVCDDVFSSEFVRAVALCMNDLELHPGKMGLHWQEESMRGDRYTWLTQKLVDSDPVLAKLLAGMEDWRAFFNETVHLNLSHCKFMAACYPGNGARYVRHSDVSPLIPDRRITAILYLNENWQKSHGGALHIDTKDGKRLEVEPVFNRVVFFCSEQMHEVRPAYKPRMAITGWYYGPDDIRERVERFVGRMKE